MESSENDQINFSKASVKYQIDFIKQEYIQMFDTWYSLKKEKTEYIKIYITLVTIPASIMLALMGFNSNESFESLIIIELLDPLAPVLAIISILGFFLTAILIDIRLEAILYIRNINSIRNAFIKFNRDIKVEEILKLPIDDETPPFKESRFFSKHVFVVSIALLNLTFMALINFLYFYSSALNVLLDLLNIHLTGDLFLIINVFFSGFFFVYHFYYYKKVCELREISWKEYSRKRKL